MKIFITGASGFVGGAVARHFAQQGHDVVAMSRSEKSDAKIKEMGAQPVRGSLGNVSPEALKGVDIIVHAAAYVEEWGSYDDFYQPNVIGTN
jgi:nucleoside-diphosphate-sugar epimerase